METTVFCPDCGGVLAGERQEGQKPCTCDMRPEAPKPGMPDPGEKRRVCCQCGKDLEGKKRFKDSLGYWCEACHYSEKKQAMANHTPCDSCGRYVETHKLVDYENIKLCSRCVKERKRASRKLRRPVSFGAEHHEHEKKRVIILAVVAVVLALIILLASLKVL